MHYANLLTLIVEWWNRTTNAKKHFRNSTSLSQTFMHNENLNQNRQSANFNEVMTLLIAPRQGKK